MLQNKDGMTLNSSVLDFKFIFSNLTFILSWALNDFKEIIPGSELRKCKFGFIC